MTGFIKYIAWMIQCVLIGIAGYIIVSLLIYVIALNSTAYKYSKQFVKSNNMIIEKLGTIDLKSFELKDMSKKYNGPEGKAHLTIAMKGNKKSGIASIEYIKTENVWYIKKLDVLINNEKLNIVNSPVKSENVD